MKNRRWYFRSNRKLACWFVFLPSEWYHVFLNKNNSWKISNKRKSLCFFPWNECLLSSIAVNTPCSDYQGRRHRKPSDDQDKDLGWVAELLAPRHLACSETSKGLAARRSGDGAFSRRLLRSLSQMQAQRRDTENWQGSVRSQPSPWNKKCRPLLVLEDGRAKASLVRAGKQRHLRLFWAEFHILGVPPRIAQLLHKEISAATSKTIISCEDSAWFRDVENYLDMKQSLKNPEAYF